MAKFLASLFEDTLGVIFEEFSKDQVSSSLFRGKFSANNLRIRRELLNEILFPFCADTASCNSVEIDLPVGSLTSMPLRVTIGQVFINLSCSPHSSPPASTFLKKLSNSDSDQKSDKKEQQDKSSSSEKGSWSKTSRIICGILLEIDLIEVRINVGSLSLRMCLRELVLQSTSADWAPVSRLGLLEQCFDESSVPGQVKLFKVLQINSLQLQILFLEKVQCSSIINFAFKVNIGVSLLKSNLRPTLICLDANISRFTVSLNNHQIERLYTAAFDVGRLFRSINMKHDPADAEASESDPQAEKKQTERVPSKATDASNALPKFQISFSLCKTEVVIGSSSPAGIPMLAEAPEVAIMAPLVEQKLSDGSSFKGNAAGYLERRSDIIKSWERRFVVVRDGDVAIFDSEEDAIAGKQPRKFFLLRECEARPAPVPGHPHAFEVLVKVPAKKTLIFSTIMAASGHVGYEARDYWIQAFLRSGSQASSGTRVVAVEDRFVEVPSVHHQAWQVALVVDPLDILSEIESDESWSIDCKSFSVSLQTQDASGNKQPMLSIHGMSVSTNFHSATSTCSLNIWVENVRILLLLQSYFKYINFLIPARFWQETLQMPFASLLEFFRGPPEVPSPLLTLNFKILINAPFHVELPFTPIDSPVDQSLHLNFLLKVNVKSGDSSRDQLRALDLYISLANFCASITSLNESSLLDLLPGIKSCCDSDEILNILAQTRSALLLLIPVIDCHLRIPLRALEAQISREFRGEPYKVCLSPSTMASENRKMEVNCDIKQNSIFLINPLMIAASGIAFKPMLDIAKEHSVFGIINSIQKLLSRVSIAQQQNLDDTALVFFESPFENLSEVSLSLNIAHVSVVAQTSARKSLLMRITGVSVQASQEPRLEFVLKQIVSSISSHPTSEFGTMGSDFITSRILYNESKTGQPAISLVVETKKAPKKINKKHFDENELADRLKWQDADSRELFREDTSDFDLPQFLASIIGSVHGLIVSLHVDELLSIDYTQSLLNDLISVLKLIEANDFIISELLAVEVAESSTFFEFANSLDVHELFLAPQPEVMEDGLSRIFDALKIKRNAKCLLGCSIGLLETSSFIQFNTTRGVETIELCIPAVLVQLIASFSLREGTISVPLVINAIQEDKAIAALLAAIYGRTPNLHLVVAAELSAFKVNAGPYGPVDPMAVVCEMRDVRVSWSTVLLSPTSWDSRSGVRSCIGYMKFCPMPEFVVTMLTFMNLVQVNTQSVMNRLQIMEQKTAYINASVKEGRRLSLKPEPASKPAGPDIVSDETLDTANSAALKTTLPSDTSSPNLATRFVEGSRLGHDELSSLLEQFDQCRRCLASTTSNVVLLKASTSPLHENQLLTLKRDEKALLDLQSSCDAFQTLLFDRVKALEAEKNHAVAEADNYRLELQKMHIARDHDLQFQATTSPASTSVSDASIRGSSTRLSRSSSSAETQQPVETFQFELLSAGMFASKWRRQQGVFHSGKFWTGSSQQSIFGRIQSCSQEKDMQHNFHCLDCVFDEKTTFLNGKEHALKFKTLSDSKEHVLAFETASAREKCLAQFKS